MMEVPDNIIVTIVWRRQVFHYRPGVSLSFELLYHRHVAVIMHNTHH